MKLALLPILLVGACSTPSPVLVQRVPSAELMTPCADPPIPSATPTAAEAATDWLTSVQVALECSARFNALVTFIKAGPKS